MRWFSNLSFRSKLLVPISLVILATAVIGFLSASAINTISAETRTITRVYLPAVQLVLEADRDMHQALIAERAMLEHEPSSPDFRGYQAAHIENIGQVRDRLSTVGELVDNPEIQALVRRFFDQFKRWEALSLEVADAAAQNPAAGIALSFGAAEQGFDTARESIDKLTMLLHGEAEANGEIVEQHAEAFYFKQLFGSGVLLALLVAMALLLPPLVTRSVNAIRARVEDIARGEGDLTQRIEVTSGDELGKLSGSFNQFMEKLQKTMADVASYTRDVAAASQQLSAIAVDNNRLVADQHESIDMVVTAANEMSSAIHDVARSTAGAAAESQTADGHSESGKRQVQQTIGAMTGLRESVEDASEVVARLAEDATKIASVLGVIRGIAEQTNLLALNAAIEAARAGEQGRGFAVVADEVRTLASRTQQSTADIEDMIGRLQQGVNSAVVAMRSGSEKADATLVDARQTEEVLAEIVQSVQRISDMSTQIASAAEEQSAVTEDINRNMVTIGDQSRQVASAAEQTTSASGELARLAGKLQDIVGQFRV